MNVVFNLNDYVSPDIDVSCYKDIPIKYRDLVRKIIKSHTKRKFAFRYRGPRYDVHRAFTKLEDANRFAVYYRDGYYTKGV